MNPQQSNEAMATSTSTLCALGLLLAVLAALSPNVDALGYLCADPWCGVLSQKCNSFRLDGNNLVAKCAGNETESRLDLDLAVAVSRVDVIKPSGPPEFLIDFGRCGGGFISKYAKTFDNMCQLKLERVDVDDGCTRLFVRNFCNVGGRESSPESVVYLDNCVSAAGGFLQTCKY